MAKLLMMFRDKTGRTIKKFGTSRVTRFLRFHWFHIPITFVLTFIAYKQYYKLRKRRQNSDQYIAPEYVISMYKMLPMRTLSRWWGWINSIELPMSMRSAILRSYVKTFGCNVDEAVIEDLKYYRNLGEFFRRELKPGLRPIDQQSGVVSPADGTVLHFGKANEGKLEQIKGITYSLRAFLGPQTWNQSAQQKEHESDHNGYQNSLLIKNNESETDLYHCVIYLAPGDYHRFHSPVQWKVKFRRHFPGQLLSVRPSFTNWFPQLFNVNERVIYVGKWRYGFFSMAAVGATNVGSIKVYFDKKLETNQRKYMKGKFNDIACKHSLRRGDAFGEFNLGSTIVLIFEAPKDAKFDIKSGQKIKYGEILCKIDDNCNDNAVTDGA